MALKSREPRRVSYYVQLARDSAKREGYRAVQGLAAVWLLANPLFIADFQRRRHSLEAAAFGLFARLESLGCFWLHLLMACRSIRREVTRLSNGFLLLGDVLFFFFFEGNNKGKWSFRFSRVIGFYWVTRKFSKWSFEVERYPCLLCYVDFKNLFIVANSWIGCLIGKSFWTRR